MPTLINSLKNTIESEEFCNRHKKNDRNFTRNRALPFSHLIYFFLNLPSAAYKTELTNFYKTLTKSDIAEAAVTKGALSRARQKLDHGAFIELNDMLVDHHNRQCNPLRWNGFFLLAIDGTTLSVPAVKEIAEHFGQWNPRQGDPCPKARVSELYDVLNHITVDALTNYKLRKKRQPSVL